MGDVRFAHPYHRVKRAPNPLDEIRVLPDEDVVAALAAAAAEPDPYVANVLATEAQNRVSRSSAIVATMAEGVFAVGPMGRLTAMNPAAERMLGWTGEEARGMDVDALLACSVQSRDGRWRSVDLCAQALAADGVVREEDALFTRRDGTTLPVAYAAAPIVRDDEVRGAVVVFRDISERKRSEEAVRRLAAIVEASDDAILSLDLDGTILTWNPRAAELYGYSAEEAIGKSAELVVPLELRAAFNELRARVGSGESLHHYETRRLQRGGKILDISLTASPIRDKTGRVVALSWIAHDVTEAKRQQDALRASEERFRLLLDSATDHAIFQLDPRGHVVTWSPAAERIKGWKAHEIIGWHYSVLFPPEEVAQGDPWKELEDAIRKGRHDGEERRIRKDGKLFDASVTLSAMRDRDGTLLGFVKVTRDISERKRWERRVQVGEERHNRLFELNPNPIAWCEPSGELVTANSALLDLLELEKEAFVGRPLESLALYEERTAVREAIARVKERGATELRCTAVARSGRALSLSCHLEPIVVDGGATGFFLVVRDVQEAPERRGPPLPDG